jgi:O-antigen/teichoic acid export membrane protein
MNKMLLNFNTVITGKIIRTILILLTTILVGRFLGPEGKGVFMLITILPTLAVTFGNIGLNNSNTF